MDVSSSGVTDTCGQTQIYMGAGVQTQALMLAQQMFLPTYPSPQPMILLLETVFYVTLAR